MSRDNKRSKPNRSSSSEDSEVCFKVECDKPKCDKPKCDKPVKRPCLSPEKIVRKLGNAVVEVHSEFIMLGTGAAGATGGTPLGANSRADIIVEGNGFFIRDPHTRSHYIVLPSQLVLLPPSLTSVANRFPFINPSDLTLGRIKNQMVRASRILVSVFNVNGQGQSFVYEADLVGVDGAGNIAVLKINHHRQWNLCNPEIEKCHPYFNFGSSRDTKDGAKVYLIGDPNSNVANRRLFNSVSAITEGLLQDHRHLEYSGFAIHESILVSASAYAFSAGLPILNRYGDVIGMQTADISATLPRLQIFSTPGSDLIDGSTSYEGLGSVGGPSEFFMRRVVKALIRGSSSRCYNCNIESICDPAGPYFRYKKAYAGIAYDVFTGVDYDVTVDYTSGLAPRGQPRVRLDSYGNFLNAPACKQLVGIRVLGLAGANPNDSYGVSNGYYYVPGGTGAAPLPASLPVSPFLGKLLPGDVITHFDGVPIGDLNSAKQIAPSLITWRLCAGDQLEVCYRRGGNALNSADNSLTENYDRIYTYVACLSDFPYLLDYPWYAVNYFPLLAKLPYPGFVFPAGQSQNPQFPALSVGADFHPAF